MSSDIAIDVQKLRKTYKDGFFKRRRFEALKGISLQVPKGVIFGLLGPNGAGKTTFIKILLGIISKTDGHATVLGESSGSVVSRAKVGYLPEHLRIEPHLTPYTALELYGNLSNVPNKIIKQRRDELLELVGLSDWKKVRVKKFSKGMLQRVGLAQAMLHDPELLVMDEPTDGLDPQARAEVREIIRRLQQKNVTIFLNSHILQEVEMICDRVAILTRGELRYNGLVKDAGNFVKNAAAPEAAQKISVSFEVIGKKETVQQIFENATHSVAPGEVADSLLIKTTCTDQNEIDSLVDKIRSHQLSLINLKRDRMTLEEAFLELVKPNNVNQYLNQ